MNQLKIYPPKTQKQKIVFRTFRISCFCGESANDRSNAIPIHPRSILQFYVSARVEIHFHSGMTNELEKEK